MSLNGQYYSLVINQESAKKETEETEDASQQMDDTITDPDQNSKLGRYFEDHAQLLNIKIKIFFF